MRKLLFCGLTLGVLGCDDAVPSRACIDAPCPRLSDEPYVRTSENGVERFWRQANRNCVTVHPVRAGSLNQADMERAIDRAARTWSDTAQECLAAMCIRVAETFDEDLEVGKDGRNLIGVVDDPATWAQIEDATEAALAVTISEVNARTGELIGADIAINAAHHVFSQRGNGPRAGETDLESVLLHEMGHLVGFDHPADDVASVMVANLPPGVTQRALTTADIAGVCETFARPSDAINRRRGVGAQMSMPVEGDAAEATPAP